MAKVRYTGADDDTVAFGRRFVRSQWQEKHGLPDEHVATLAANPHFEVAGFSTVTTNETGGEVGTKPAG